MITIDKIIQVTLGNPPYDWNISSNCDVTVLPTNGGTTSGQANESLISFTLSFPTSQALEGCQAVMLNITDSDECFKSFSIPIYSPCSNFNSTGIQRSYPFTFSILPQAGNPPYTYNWIYDTDLFQVAPGGSNGSNGVLELSPIVPVNDSGSSTVYVVVTDAEGCSLNDSYTIIFNKPTALDTTQYAVCTDNGYFITTFPLAISLANGSQVVNWSTLNISTPINTVTSQTEPGITYIFNDYTVQANVAPTVAPGTYRSSWTVSTTDNVQSTVGYIYIIVPDCSDPVTDISASPYVYVFNCPEIGDSVTIELEPLVTTSGGSNIDWNTLQILNGPYLTGATAEVDQIDRQIVYTVGTDIDGVDKVDWQVCLDDGQCSNIATIYFNLVCDPAPVAVDDEECLECTTTAIIDVLANDTGNIDPSSLQITQFPSHGSLFVNPATGVITYTADGGYSGPDQFKYVVGSPSGVLSNEATVDVDIICAGVGGIVLSCS